jgi:AraC-like DNA-binding protein
MDARRLIRKTVELSLELHTVTALARSLYLSRRALGRRFLSRGLPVPSHWLHFGRILRAALRLQNTDETLASAAYHFGYPDAFAFSNQMYRLTGVRPSEARRCLGWEWLVEAWLQTERGTGGLSEDLARTLVDEAGTELRSKDPDIVKDTKRTAHPDAPPPQPSRKLLSSRTKAKP